MLVIKIFSGRKKVFRERKKCEKIHAKWLPSSMLNGKSPYEMIYKKPPTLSYLRVFGCLCFATIINNHDKFCSRSEKCVMIGYSNYKRGYRLYSLDRHQFIFSRDGKLFESVFPSKDTSSKEVNTLNVFQDINHIHFFDIEYPEMPNDDERVYLNLNSDNKSKNYSSHSSVSVNDVNTADFPDDSENDVNSSEDVFAIQHEKVTTLGDNIIFEGNLDQNPNTSIQGAQNVEGLQGKKWTPYLEMVFGKLWICPMTERPVFQLDVINAFLYGDLDEIVYMKPPTGQRKSDYSLYTKSNKDIFLALLVYVDDIIIPRNNVSEIEKFKFYLKSKFIIKELGKLKYFLSIKVIHTDRVICLNQSKYVLDLLSEYGMLAFKPTKTPLISKLVISNEAFDDDPILDNITDYQKLMGKLINLTNTRPDISYDVHCLSLGIHIIKDSGIKIKGFSDADWAKCTITRKSVRGYCDFLNNSLVSCKSRKQNTRTKSSTEAEYKAIASVTSEVILILD
nr:ribonuclease H-like domain-containing protein [Tanacetum cinerariifolium]